MKEDNGKIYILDTSALLTYIEDEKGSDVIDDILIKAEKGEVRIYIAFVSLTEVYYITIQEKGEPEALRRVNLIQSLSLTVEESNGDLNLKAGSLKAANRISLADAYIALFVSNMRGCLSIKPLNLKACHL